MKLDFDTNSMDSYRQFLRLKRVPTYSWRGTSVIVPDEYAGQIDGVERQRALCEYVPSEFCFDYQADIARMAIEKRKFAAFVRCGLGKTIVMLEFARHAALQLPSGQASLIISPLMVIGQTVSESARFYPDMPVEQIKAADLQSWLDNPTAAIGITNYEAIREGLNRGQLGALILDESSLLKSHYGAWGTRLIELGKGIEWKLALTGTPAPNDRIEFANHAVFVDAFRTVNEFLARYFINRAQLKNKWELKPHALKPFYRDLAHWCIFVSNPAVYGWRDNCDTIPPIKVHIDHIDMTVEQRKDAQQITGGLFVKDAGGIGTRGKLSQLAKGKSKGVAIATEKPGFIRRMVDSWPDESTIIWCHYNQEQDSMVAAFPEAASISGDTPIKERIRLIEDFKAGRVRIMISKPKVLGFGLNLQVATRQVFSGLQDSYEEFWQAVCRSNRVGSTRPLNVHIPITEIEEPMIRTVLAKASRVEADTIEQERLFKRNGHPKAGER